MPGPEVTVEHYEDLFIDELGQRWSPATVTMQWPGVPAGLRAPTLTCDVIALARADMTAEELAASHIQSLQDVLTAALKALNDPAHRQLFRKTAGGSTQ